MRLHRFYSGPDIKLEHYVHIQQAGLLKQWRQVLRFRSGQQLILFNGQGQEKLYSLTQLGNKAAELELITELSAKTPNKQIYLLWSLLKKDKNDWVLQKATELGVSHLVPVLAERSEKTGFNLERAQRIVIEAAEQCGRGDIPSVSEPLLLQTAIHQYGAQIPLLAAEQGSRRRKISYGEVGVLIGPEGGWSEREKQLFASQEIGQIPLSDFTLRAETAAVIAVQNLM